MMDFQREPDRDKPSRCEKCHMVLIKPLKVTSESEPYCMHCGHVLGTSVEPAIWSCTDCGKIHYDVRPGDARPYCLDCEIPMSCSTARPSRVHGAGVGDKDLEYGLAFLMKAQGADLGLGTDILRDCQEQ